MMLLGTKSPCPLRLRPDASLRTPCGRYGITCTAVRMHTCPASGAAPGVQVALQSLSEEQMKNRIEPEITLSLSKGDFWRRILLGSRIGLEPHPSTGSGR